MNPYYQPKRANPFNALRAAAAEKAQQKAAKARQQGQTQGASYGSDDSAPARERTRSKTYGVEESAQRREGRMSQADKDFSRRNSSNSIPEMKPQDNAQNQGTKPGGGSKLWS